MYLKFDILARTMYVGRLVNELITTLRIVYLVIFVQKHVFKVAYQFISVHVTPFATLDAFDMT